MSAAIDTMLYVGEKPWHGLGVKYDAPPKTAEEIIKGTNLDWKVSSHVMSSDMNKEDDYHAIYRDDTKQRLGVVHTKRPQVVQNDETFLAVESQLGVAMDVETAASLGIGQTVFGCFKLRKDDTILDDKIETYFIIMNDHQKADGKVTVFNTPIRVVCQNTLSAGLSNATFKARIPITDDISINQQTVNLLFDMHTLGITNLSKKAEQWAKRKLSRDQMDKIMDELFPFPEGGEDASNSKKFEKVDMQRSTFLEKCMQADNLNNVRGTVYQVFNALTDYTQHYVSNPDKVFDLKYRMNTLPGIGVDSPAMLVTKFLKTQNRMFA